MFCPNPECPDFLDTGIHGEYVDTVSKCPRCGAQLVVELSPEVPHRIEVEPDREEVAAEAGEPSALSFTGPLVSIAAFDRSEEAQAIVDFLAEQGVTAFEFLDDGRDFEDNSGFSPCSRVLVPQGEAPLALRLVKETGR